MRLIKSTAIIGSLTMVSRVLGLVRDILMARFLGAGIISDALFTAIKLPNLFRRMFAEGAFNSAFVPLYARRIEEEGDEAAATFAGEAMSALFLLVAVIVIAFQITMPWSLNIVGAGLDKVAASTGAPVPYDLAVLYARITMPYLLLMSLAALFSGVLNTRGYFVAAAFAPILLNLVVITVFLTTTRGEWDIPRLALYVSMAWTASGVLQAGLLIWGCRNSHIRLPILRPRMTPGVKRLLVLGVPGMLSAGITHINLTVSHLIATTMDSAASWLYYADRLYQLPLGIIGIAMGIALLPALSRRLRAGDDTGAMLTMNRAMEIAAFLTLPATIALAIMPEFLIGGLFERGEFSANDTSEAAKALRMFAFGLPAFVLLKVLAPAFFAREDTKTPMIYAGMSAIINVSLGAYLFFNVGFYGLALATSVAAWANAVCLAIVLFRNGNFIPDTRLMTRVPKIAMAAIVMGVGLWFVVPHVQPMLEGKILTDYILLTVVALGGVALYGLAAILLRAYGISDIKDALGRKA